jgi:outer membrane protein assembly factor BamB
MYSDIKAVSFFRTSLVKPARRGLQQGVKWYFLTLGVLLASAVMTAVRADDWPQWLGPRRDGVWRENGILDRFPEGGPKVRWRARVGAGYAGPAIAGNRVYLLDRVLAEGTKNHAEPFPQRPNKGIAGTERVLCLSDQDGSLLWKYEYDCPYTISYPLGPRATPLIRDGKVYTFGAEGNLFCLDVATGKLVWGRDLKKDYGVKAPLWGFASHPLLDGDKLICLVGGDGTTVIAFDKNSGKELWRALKAKEPGYAPPMIYELGGKRQLIVWHAEAVNGLDPETGHVYWTQPAKTYMGMSIATPRRVGDAVFVTAHPSLALLLHPKSDGAAPDVVWRGDKKTGFSSVFSTPFAEDGYLYGVQSGGMLCCVKAATGERLWETAEPVAGKRLGSAECFLVKNGDRFFVFNEKGDLLLARLSPKGYEQIGRTHLLDPTSAAFGRDVLWSPPAFAHRCVYVRNDKELICVSLAAEQPRK